MWNRLRYSLDDICEKLDHQFVTEEDVIGYGYSVEELNNLLNKIPNNSNRCSRIVLKIRIRKLLGNSNPKSQYPTKSD